MDISEQAGSDMSVSAFPPLARARRSLRPPGARMAGAALWTTRLDRRSAGPLSRQLAAALREAISDGRLDGGARLPSTRALAAELGLARSTVVGVYEQLTTEGFIAARPGSGHTVPARPVDSRATIWGASDGAPPRSPVGQARGLRLTSRQAVLLRGVAPEWRGLPRPFDMGHADIHRRFITTW